MVVIVTNIITLTAGLASLPEQIIPLVESDAAPIPCLEASISPKSDAFPVDGIVKKSILFKYPLLYPPA